MAFRNSVKATLFEPEQPRSRSDEPRAIVEEPAPAPPVAPRPPENQTKPAPVARPAAPAAQRASENVAQRPVENAAQRASKNTAQPALANVAERPTENVAQRTSANPAKPPPVAKAATATPPQAKHEVPLAAAWHARAEQLCAMANTLPCETSWSLISKIAHLYDELARDAGWTEPEALAPDAVRLEAPPAEEDLQAKEERPAAAPQAADPPEERTTFSRRPLPLGRRFPRRRA